MKAAQRRELELDQGDEQLDRQHEKGEQDDDPGEQQDDDLDEILKETDIAHQPRDGVEDRSACIEPDLRHAPGLEQLRGGEAGPAGLEAEPGETVEDDLRQRVPVADDIGEDPDEQRLLDQPGDDVVALAHRPEQRGKRHIDHDQRRRDERDLAVKQPEPGIDIAGEDLKKAVDDAGAAHVSAPRRLRHRARSRIARSSPFLDPDRRTPRSSSEAPSRDAPRARGSGADSPPRREDIHDRPRQPRRATGTAPTPPGADPLSQRSTQRSDPVRPAPVTSVPAWRWR
jgi:hypothetical protein